MSVNMEDKASLDERLKPHSGGTLSAHQSISGAVVSEPKVTINQGDGSRRKRPGPRVSRLPQLDEGTREEYKRLQAKIAKLEKKKVDLIEAYDSGAQFRLSFMEDNDDDIELYTGFPNHMVMMTFYQFLDPGIDGANVVNCAPGSAIVEGQRLSNLSLENEYFLTLMKLRLGLFNQDLACRFGIDVKAVMTIFAAWTNFIHQKLQPIVLWPTRKIVDQYMPASFKTLFPKTRVILDFVELKIGANMSQPTDDFELRERQKRKGMVALLPSGHVCLVSGLFHHGMLERDIAIRSQLLEQTFDENDTFMAERSAEIEKIGRDSIMGTFKNVKLHIPPFFESDDRFNAVEAAACETVHDDIIKCIDRVRSFLIFERVLPDNEANKIWDICCRLVNCQMPVIVKANCYE